VRKWVANRGRFGIKEEKGLYTKGQGVESRNNLVVLWYTGVGHG